MFFSRAILAAENKPSVVHIKLFTRLLNSDVVRQLQRLGFEILIVPFHCLSSSLFRQFWHCTFMISLQCAHHPYRTYPEYLKKKAPGGEPFLYLATLCEPLVFFRKAHFQKSIEKGNFCVCLHKFLTPLYIYIMVLYRLRKRVTPLW